MSRKKHYNPIPVVGTDKRVFRLSFSARSRPVYSDFTQLDFLQIHRHVKNRNARLAEQIRRFIKACDEENKELTDFVRKVPGRRINGE